VRKLRRPPPHKLPWLQKGPTVTKPKPTPQTQRDDDDASELPTKETMLLFHYPLYTKLKTDLTRGLELLIGGTDKRLQKVARASEWRYLAALLSGGVKTRRFGLVVVVTGFFSHYQLVVFCQLVAIEAQIVGLEPLSPR